MVWCVYPPTQKGTPVFRETSHWIFFDEDDHYPLLECMMDATSGKSMVVGRSPPPGSWLRLTIIIACGEPEFSGHVRKAVIDRRADRTIEFVELQYRPNARLSRGANDKDVEKGMNKLSSTDDVDLEKGRNKRGVISPGEGEDWDEITLCSQTGTPVNDEPQKKWQ